MNTPANKLLRLTVLTAFGTALAASPALSQGYHYSSGNARVVNQNQTGLYYSESTYIGPGTISKTAQGKSVSGAQANPLLPKVPWGANIATPGDNFYTKDKITPMQNGTPVGVPQANWGANVKQPGDNMRSDMGQPVLRQEYKPGQVFQRRSGSGSDAYGYGGSRGQTRPKGHLYTPGTNGMASYGDDTANGTGGSGTRY